MRLTVTSPGADAPFEGDATLFLQALPADARVIASEVRLEPVGAPGGELFTEVLSFAGGRGERGATKVVGADFVEVDLHARRTHATAGGTKLAGTVLLVDLGGVYVEVGERGGIRGPGEAAFPVGADGVLPGLTVSRFRLAGQTGADISRLAVRSVPTNVSVRVGALPPVWSYPGELAQGVVTGDFGAVLAAVLVDAPVVAGTFRIPLTVHSDTLCRFAVEWTIEYLRTVPGLPEGVADAQVVFDYAGVPRSTSPAAVALPAGARVVATSGHLTGAFEPTRVLDGAVGAVTAAPGVTVSGGRAQAHPVHMPVGRRLVGADLLLASTKEGCVLQLQVVDDLDGKPGGTTLLAQPATVRLPPAAAPDWAGVRFPAALTLLADSTYWLVLQALEGAAVWSVAAATDAGPGLHYSTDGGLSWRASSTVQAPTPLRARVRLRGEPDVFTMPVHLVAGPPAAVEVRDGRVVEPGPTGLTLERFAVQGRVAVSLDLPELGPALQARLEQVAPVPCPETEHLLNGEFTRWITVGDVATPESWTLTDGSVTQPELPRGVILGSADRPTGLSQLTAVQGGCRYRLEVIAGTPDGDAAVELIWRGADCHGQGLDRLELTVPPVTGEHAQAPLQRLVVSAPADAVQVEVRALLSVGASVLIETISLAATTDRLRNGDLQEGVERGLPVGWSPVPVDAGSDLRLAPTPAGVRLGNRSGRALTLVQLIEPGQGDYEVVVDALLLAGAEPAPYVELAAPSGRTGAGVLRQPLRSGSFGRYLLHGVATTALELRLVLPPQADTVEYSLLWRGASLRQPRQVDIPLSFVAQAPGQLTVRGFAASYDLVQAERPPTPAAGLCRPTAPDAIPGVAPDNCHYCVHCRGQRPVVGPAVAQGSGGESLAVGRCASCGNPMLSGAAPEGGAGAAAGLRPAPAYQGPVLDPVPPDEVSPQVMRGIGPVRAALLVEVGISTVLQLAESSPVAVSTALPGVPLQQAEALVTDARGLIGRAYRIRWVTGAPGMRDYERIEAIGGTNIDGTPWRICVGRAVAGMESGSWELYVEDPSGERRPVVVSRADGRLFLSTTGDRMRPNDLFALPAFPRQVVDDIRRFRSSRTRSPNAGGPR
jgi:hypothetical protein